MSPKNRRTQLTKNSNTVMDRTITSSTTSSNSNNNNTEALRLYEAIIFSGPIIFTLIILFLFYYFYLRRHSVDWSSLRMRQSRVNSASAAAGVGVGEVGLRKEYREMLPIIIYKESFSVKDTQCSVCLGDYQAEDKLQQMPGCGHTFHLNCIDNWLATHTTCPLCRLSLISSSKNPTPSDPDSHTQTDSRFNSVQNVDGVLLQNSLQIL